MKVVDKKLLFISSSERDSGDPADFKISLPSHLVVCRANQRLRMVLNDLVLPYTWFNIQESNRKFFVTENGNEHEVVLALGSYNALQLRDHLITSLDNASAVHGEVYTYTVEFSEIDSKYTFTITHPVGVNQIRFTNRSQVYANNVLEVVQ